MVFATVNRSQTVVVQLAERGAAARLASELQLAS